GGGGGGGGGRAWAYWGLVRSSAWDEGRAARRGGHHREAKGVRHVRWPRTGRAAHGSAGADDRQRGLQRGRCVGDRDAAHARQAARRPQGVELSREERA